MIATFKPCTLRGSVSAPPSKSMAHRRLIGAALSQGISCLSGVDYSEDILASIDCLKALGAQIETAGDCVTVNPQGFMKAEFPVLECRESGSTLRFLIPLALCLGRKVVLRGSERLMERPLDVYEALCSERGFAFDKSQGAVSLCGHLTGGEYQLRGDISSQFITGLLFALVYLNEPSVIRIIPPFESSSYVHLTLDALQAFGADAAFVDEYTIAVRQSQMHACSGRVEGDYSNAAFLDAFNRLGSQINIGNLNPGSLQGDRVYADYFRQLDAGTPTLDLSDCPDLGPVLFSLAALKNGAVFTGTQRLKAKESDRGWAMHQELAKLGGGLVLGEGQIIVPKQKLEYRGKALDGHNDHRIVMALSVVLSQTGGSIAGAQAVRKSYPGFFDDIRRLGAKVTLK